MKKLLMHKMLECHLRHRKTQNGAFPSGKSGEDIEATDTLIASITQLDKVQHYWLSCFILEVKKKGDAASEFPTNTSYHILLSTTVLLEMEW